MSAGCAGHADLADELREYAAGALNLIEPWLAQIRERPADPASPEPASCAVCPLCAVIMVLRGGRSELAVKVTEQATGLLVVLRAALAEGVGSHPGQPQAPPSHGRDGARPPDERRGVQRIVVTREEDASSRPC